MTDNKLSLQNELTSLDLKDRNFYDNLSEEEKKKFSPYLMLRYGSSVEANADMQAWYLMATNERVNKNFFDISTSKHKKLQWLMCTTISPSMGRQKHYWLPTKKSEKNNKIIKFLTTLFPDMKLEDIEILAELNSKENIKELARAYGWADSDIKKEIG
jgi:hypothetical protein